MVYRFISHKESAAAHPDCCTEKDSMPWSGEEKDPLAPQLHTISGGRAKFRAGWMKRLRKSGLSDDRIAAEFRTFLDQNPQNGRDWKLKFYLRFKDHLIRVSAYTADVADNAKDLCNDQSHKSGTHQPRTIATHVSCPSHVCLAHCCDSPFPGVLESRILDSGDVGSTIGCTNCTA